MSIANGVRLGSIRGIPIRLHPTFLVVVPFLAWAFGGSFAAAARLAGVPPEAVTGPRWAWGLAIALALFASVLVHELAHALYALANGGAVRSITLMMIGGVTEVARPPRGPAREAVMALAGPLTSVALGGVLFLGFWAARDLPSPTARFALFYVAQLNLFLGLFNLVPAFPMDGGRILRGVLATRLGLARATRVAAIVGRAFALLFAAAGVATGNLLLAAIGVFVFLGAGAEARAVALRDVLGDLRVSDLMARRVPVVLGSETADAVAERMVRERRLSFPVVEGEDVAGEVTFEAVSRIPPAERRTTPVRQVMAPAAVVSPGDRVAEALERFPGPDGELAVRDGGRLVGTLSRAEVARVVRLRQLEAR